MTRASMRPRLIAVDDHHEQIVVWVRGDASMRPRLIAVDDSAALWYLSRSSLLQ